MTDTPAAAPAAPVDHPAAALHLAAAGKAEAAAIAHNVAAVAASASALAHKDAAAIASKASAELSVLTGQVSTFRQKVVAFVKAHGVTILLVVGGVAGGSIVGNVLPFAWK